MVLRDSCVDPSTGKPRLVLDVGANFGSVPAGASTTGCLSLAN